jgi:Acetyltransferase (GNAT) domain
VWVGPTGLHPCTRTMQVQRMVQRQAHSTQREGVLAAIGGITIDPIVPDALRMRRFYVRPAFRRTGIRGEIAQALLKSARSIPLVTLNAAVKSVPCWKTLGFVPQARTLNTACRKWGAREIRLRYLPKPSLNRWISEALIDHHRVIEKIRARHSGWRFHLASRRSRETRRSAEAGHRRASMTSRLLAAWAIRLPMRSRRCGPCNGERHVTGLC